jgi:hypothetical protein
MVEQQKAPEAKPKRKLRTQMTIRSIEALGLDLEKMLKQRGLKELQGINLTWDTLLRFANSVVEEGEPFTKDSPLNEVFEVLVMLGESGFLAESLAKGLKKLG